MKIIPALRDDLEVTRRPDGQVDVRDPRLLNVFTLDSEYLEVAVHFDGLRGAKEVVEAHRLADKKKIRPKEVKAIAEEMDALLLLDTEEAATATPNMENTSPQPLLGPAPSSHRLRVLPQTPASSAWSCQACGACCHGLVVELTEAEEARIDASLYQDVLDGQGFAYDAFVDPELPAVRVLRQRVEDRHACVFLAEDGRCLVHARQGPESKPDACQIFPYMVVHVPGRTPHLAMRTNCQS
ncbi:MAG: YkgJ family cysteine cluster protein, partial [Myxococcota bacterium]